LNNALNETVNADGKGNKLLLKGNEGMGDSDEEEDDEDDLGEIGDDDAEVKMIEKSILDELNRKGKLRPN
jgi:hypothetical protein